MKPIFVAVVALLASVGRVMAADIARCPRAETVPANPCFFSTYYNWSGIYLGVNGGYGFGQSNWTSAGVSTGNFNTNGFLVGGTLGANYRRARIWSGSRATSIGLVSKVAVPPPPALPSEPLPAQPAKTRKSLAGHCARTGGLCIRSSARFRHRRRRVQRPPGVSSIRVDQSRPVLGHLARQRRRRRICLYRCGKRQSRISLCQSRDRCLPHRGGLWSFCITLVLFFREFGPRRGELQV